ncbi:MAG: FAD-dependent oxidoreductase [Acidobacteriales bacterium]|nr:FAD-dependent oxidoreductase [Terriglobales bacterium]
MKSPRTPRPVFTLLLLTSFVLFGTLSLSAAPVPAAAPSADVVVYGGTASGVIAAYAAAREGLHVVLLEPRGHLGGMVTGGLSATDLANFTVIGGYARDFYTLTAAHYGIHDLDQAIHWKPEPHVAEQVFNQMLKEAGVDVRLHERVKEHTGVVMQNGRILRLVTEDGRQWNAKVFLDCSYEGDVMAQSGVKYTIGRESTSQYGESLAGVRADTPKHQFQWPLSAYDSQHHLLPEISARVLPTPGSADKAVQAYNLRLILTKDKSDQAPFTRPANYSAARYELLLRYLDGFEKNMGRKPTVHDVTNPVAILGNKSDFNNNGPFSTDYIGHSWQYPDASYAQKQRIWQDHLSYVQGFFYFLSHDPRVPASVQQDLNQWGLAKDEFTDSGHWPNQLYIREGRRMIGVYVMRQADLQTARTKPDSIGMGSYQSDSHNVERIVQNGFVKNEGDVQVPVQPYEIPYRVLLPDPATVTNLLVPVCFSASHVAYSSLRMEPQYMIMGQAAGVAAALAVHHAVPVQKVPVEELQQKLHAQKAVLHLADANANKPSGAQPASH